MLFIISKIVSCALHAIELRNSKVNSESRPNCWSEQQTSYCDASQAGILAKRVWGGNDLSRKEAPQASPSEAQRQAQPFPIHDCRRR